MSEIKTETSRAKFLRVNVKKDSNKQFGNLYRFAGVAAFIVVFASLADIAISMMLDGGSVIPETAADRFAQFQSNPLLGLYYLDFLNMLTAIIMIPVFFAICAAHQFVRKEYSALSLLVFTVGTAIFITNNAALPMLSLSNRYVIATNDAQRLIISAAGEALLARGAHGSPGAFIGFLLPIIASFIISVIMWKGGVFSKLTGILGMAGSVLFMVYFVLITFIPDAETLVMMFAMVGGLLSTVWIVFFALRLLKLGNSDGKTVLK